MTTKKAVDILSISAVELAGKGYDLSMHDGANNDLGFSITILGSHSDVVTKHTNRVANKAIQDEAIARKKGKYSEPRKLEEIRENNIEAAAVRVIGWKNVNEPFTKETLKEVLVKNPQFVEQIIEASNDMGNFTKPQ